MVERVRKFVSDALEAERAKKGQRGMSRLERGLCFHGSGAAGMLTVGSHVYTIKDMNVDDCQKLAHGPLVMRSRAPHFWETAISMLNEAGVQTLGELLKDE